MEGGPSAPTSRRQGLLAGSATYLVANLVNAAIPFALLPVLTRYMSPAEYGQVAMYQVLLTALGGLLGLSVNGAAGIKYYDDDITHLELGSFIGACFQILCATAGALLLVAYFARAQLAESLGLRPEWVIWAVFVSAAGFVQQLRLGQWQVRGQALQYGIFQISASVVNAGLSLLMVVVLVQGARGRIDAMNWTLLVFALAAVAMLARDKLLGWSWRPDYIKEALRFGVPLVPHVLGLFLLGTVDRVVINKELGLTQAGFYMVAVQLTLAMPILFSAINNAYVPWLFERLKRNEMAEKRHIVRMTYLYFAAVLVMAGLAFVLGPWAVRVIAGTEYQAAGSAIGWLALGQAFGGMYLMVTNYIFFSKRTGLLALVTIGSGALNLALLVLLVRSLGIQGAAIAFAVAMGIRFLLVWRVAQMRHPMPWSAFKLDTTVKGFH